MKKKLLTLLGFSALTFGAFSQTWEFTNEPAIDASRTMYLVDTTSANLASQSGANQTWDFSLLAGYEENMREVSVSNADEFPSFPDATHMLLIPGFMNTAYVYADGTNDKLAHGYQFELPDLGEVTFVFDDLQKMMQFPTSLGTTFTDNMSGTFTIFDEDNDAEGQTWVTADGSGTLILANDVTHTGVLRIHTIDTLYADVVITSLQISTSATIVRETFDYIKPGTSSFPLFTHATLKILNPLIGQVKLAVVVSTENPTTFVNIDAANLDQAKVFPNPSNGTFTVVTGNADASSVSILDITGRLVFENSSVTNQIQIDLSQELPGIYFVHIVRAGITTVEKVIMK
jgi:hypothetical protein